MAILRFKNFIYSVVSLGCLFFIAGIIILLIIARNINEQGWDWIFRYNNEPSAKEITYLGPVKDKPILTRVAVMSDSESDWNSLGIALKEVKARGIEHVIHLGDLTQLGVEADFAVAKKLFDESGLNYYVVPGDRDLWKSGGSVSGFSKYFGDSYRLVEIDSINVMLIDNSNEFEGIDPDQWQFIESNLPNSDWIVIHNPIHISSSIVGQKGMGDYSQEVEDQRVALLDKVKNSDVKIVLAGDQHLFSENVDTDRRSLSYYVAGSLSQGRNLQQPNFFIITVYEDMDYTVEQVVL